MLTFILFLFGAAIGSFLNVIALRYDPDRFLFARPVIGGRSHCPHCGRTLRWFELVPFISFIVLRGRCGTCRARLSPQYFLAELLSGLIFAFVPHFSSAASFELSALSSQLLLSSLWILAFETLLLMSLIDIRLHLIPDEVHGILIVLAALRLFLERGVFLFGSTSFVSRYAAIFGFDQGMLGNHIVGALVGALFFLGLILVTRGRGMGMGDAKLALALGFLFGWPDIIFIIMFAFVIGAICGLWVIMFSHGRLKSALPFGPFLALGAFALFLWGNQILGWYFGLFRP